MGRSGTEIPPEVVMASLITLATIFLSSFFVSIPTLCATVVSVFSRITLKLLWNVNWRMQVGQNTHDHIQ